MTASVKDQIEGLFKKISIAVLKWFIHSRELPYPRGRKFASVLVIHQHDQLGDMLCVVPLLRYLKRANPGGRITLVTGPVNHEIMLHHPYADAVLMFPKGRILSIIRLVLTIRKTRYDMAVVPGTVSFSLTSSLLAVCSRAPVRIGPASIDGRPNPGGFCFTVRVALDWRSEPHRHQTLRNLDFLLPAGANVEDRTTTIGITDTEKAGATALLSAYRKRHRFLVGIHPGAGKPANRWPPEKFVAVVNRLHHENNAGIILSIGPMDDAVLGQVAQNRLCDHLLLHNRAIREVAAVIDQLDLFISNDTGIMHVAGATSARLLALFGPTDPLQWAPVGKKNSFIAAKDGDLQRLREEDVYQMALLILSSPEKYR